MKQVSLNKYSCEPLNQGFLHRIASFWRWKKYSSGRTNFSSEWLSLYYWAAFSWIQGEAPSMCYRS